MTLRYDFATIQFCPDLTDPDATSTPVALVAVGPGAGWLFLGVRPDPFSGVTIAPFKDLAEFLRRTIERGRREHPTPDLLTWLGEQLGGTIWVSAPARREVELADGNLLRELLGKLEAEVPMQPAVRALEKTPYFHFEPMEAAA